MKHYEDYYLGLDIGTNSVGWAVTDPRYNLCKFNQKSMWGIRLFESANTAADRRMKRANRRRLQRRVQRINLLQDLFKEEICKVDPTFFIRLNESRLHIEDKSEEAAYRHPLFIMAEYSDIEYYEQYPTIFHLRKELIESSEPHDIRLVYLAIHHILKYRGHFLIDGSLGDAKKFETVFAKVVELIQDEENGLGISLSEVNEEAIEHILRNNKLSKSEKAKQMKNMLPIDEAACVDKEEAKKQKAAIDNICKLIVGNKGDISKILKEDFAEFEKTSFAFADSTYDETVRPEMESLMPDACYFMDCIKAVYDWSVLVDILGDEEYISFAKVNQYEKHQQNLKILRELMKKYCDKKIYKKFFDGTDEKTANYAHYVGSVKTGNKKISLKKCSEEDFYKELKKILENMKIEGKDIETYQSVCDEAEKKTLLPLQRSKDNSSVPKQIHEAELERILANASLYLPFLKFEDADGLDLTEKIISIFNFRIPYYVGPLSTRHKKNGANVWIQRKEEGYIYPWNFEQKVDEEASNESFIRRMTNKCTYIPTEDVIPKMSLLYSKFMVLNELNNLKIRGKEITVSQKQAIYNDLFKTRIRVTGAKLLEYLKQDDPTLKKEDLSGFDQDFKANLTSYLDFEKKVFGDRICEDEVKKIVEDIIRWKTIYGDDWKMTKKVILANYPKQLSEEELKKVMSFRYNGWGNFSERFLNGISGIDKETGEVFTIIEALWETNCNLMQLLSSKFTFKEEIERINAENRGEITNVTYDSVVKDLFVSPSVKRAIWQSIQIVEEIKQVMGHAPEKIFVEMARGEEEKKRTQSRKSKLLELYESCKGDTRDWCKEIEEIDERSFNSMKLYLYYTQMGRCMYSGEPIDIEQLMAGNPKWDRDHIYPQSKVKDDSIDNLVLVNREYNAKKSDGLISDSVQRQQKAWWAMLLEKGFITKKKYDRLMRKDDFSPEELGGFISRQLVETRQSSKAVVELLKQLYASETTKIIPIKAGIVSDFRKNDLKMMKSRRINDYHHAKDAYLNIVAGDVYSTKFTLNPMQWVKDKQKSEDERIYNISRVFDYDVYRNGVKIWEAPEYNGKKRNESGEKVGGTLEQIRKTMRRNDILYTEYSYCGKGQLFNETIEQKSKAAAIQLKKGLDTSKYGGYSSAKTAYFALVEFDGKKEKRVRNIMEVPIYIANMLPHNPDAYLEYCENVKGLKNVQILRECIKKNALIEVNGYAMRIRSSNETNLQFKNNIQLCLNSDEETIRKIEKYLDKNKNYDANEKFDHISLDETEKIYDDLAEKLISTYAQRPANQGRLLKEKRQAFLELSLTERIKLINQIITMLRCDIESKADLTAIDGNGNAGSMSVKKNTIGKSKLVLVNQSVTGLFENRIEL